MPAQPQPATVHAVNADTVVLDIGGTHLSWPRADVPDVSTGDTIHLLALSSKDLTEHQDAVATSLLNSLLTPPHETKPKGK